MKKKELEQVLKDWYNYLMDEQDGILREEFIYLYTEGKYPVIRSCRAAMRSKCEHLQLGKVKTCLANDTSCRYFVYEDEQ